MATDVTDVAATRVLLGRDDVVDRRCCIGVHDVTVATLRIAQDPAADALLHDDPLALLLGMALDQRIVSPSAGG